MTARIHDLLIASFENVDHARGAVSELREIVRDDSDLGLVTADSSEARRLLEEGPSNPGRAAAIGSAVGGSLFGLAAAVLAGPVGVLAVGPFIALLGGATAGAGAGGLLGALVGLGIPEHEAELRATEVRNGGALVTVPLTGDDDIDEGIRRALGDARSLFTV